MIVLSVLPAALLLPGYWEPAAAETWRGAPSAVRLAIGCIIVAAGIIKTIDLYCRSRWDRFYLDAMLGVLFISAGMILVTYKGTGMWAVTPILSLYFALEGVTKIYLSIELRSDADICLIFAGTLSLIRGFFFMYFGLFQEIYLWVLALFIGMDLFLEGLCGIVNKLTFAEHAGGDFQS